MPIPFSAEPQLINVIFGRDITYTIPEYQRPYSWECLGKSDRNNQVIKMWEDLYTHFSVPDNDNDYFFGSIVLIDKGQRTYEVIDGQQRLTTTILLFVAIKEFLAKKKPEINNAELLQYMDRAMSLMDDIIHNQKLFGAEVSEKKIKIERNSGFDYDAIFENVVNGADLPDLRGFTKENAQVIERYFKNRDYFIARLREVFLVDGNFEIEQARQLNNFIEYLKNKVSFVRILAGNFNTAYHVFEILNNRGLALSNKDLLRNFIIKEFDLLKRSNPQRYAALSPSDKWNEIDSLNDDFIGRWVESFTATQQKSSAFNDVREIYNESFAATLAQSKIEIFFNILKRDLTYYNDIVNFSSNNAYINSKLKFIVNAPNVRYGLNFLLSLSKNLQGLDRDPELTLRYLVEYERYLLNACISRFNYGPVYKCIALLNANDQRALTYFEDSNTYSRPILEVALRNNFYENEIAKLLIAKYVWIIEANTSDDVVEQALIYEKSTLEHIIPQNPDAGTNWLVDFSKEFREQHTYSLGNMTLLTGRMNSAAKNYDFQRKKIQYAKTKLPITVQIETLGTITPDYIQRRNNDIISVLAEDFGLQ